MLSESERYWAMHLQNAGKSVTQIAQIISQKRTDEGGYTLLKDIVDYVNQMLGSTKTKGREVKEMHQVLTLKEYNMIVTLCNAEKKLAEIIDIICKNREDESDCDIIDAVVSIMTRLGFLPDGGMQ